VVDSNQLLVGVISQHDLLRALTKTQTAAFDQQTFYYALPVFGEGFIPEGDGLSPTLDMPIAEFMNPDVLTVSAQDSVGSVATLMCRNHIHRVVVADGKKIKGIISVFDLIGTMESA
jgi:CBS domain-containing protein